MPRRPSRGAPTASTPRHVPLAMVSDDFLLADEPAGEIASPPTSAAKRRGSGASRSTPTPAKRALPQPPPPLTPAEAPAPTARPAKGKRPRKSILSTAEAPVDATPSAVAVTPAAALEATPVAATAALTGAEVQRRLQSADDSQEELDSFLQLISQEMGEAPEEAGLAKETVRELHGQYTALRDRRQLRGPLPTSTVSLFHSLLVPLDSIVSAGIGALKPSSAEPNKAASNNNEDSEADEEEDGDDVADDDAAAGVEQSFASADAARFALDILTTPANHSQIISESVLTSLISLVSHQVAVLVSYWGKGKALPSGLAKLRPRTVMLLKQLTLLVEQINLTDQHLVLLWSPAVRTALADAVPDDVFMVCLALTEAIFEANDSHKETILNEAIQCFPNSPNKGTSLSPSAGAKPLRIMRVTRLLLRLLQAIARGAANKALEAHRRVQTQESASQVSTALYNAHDYTARYATGLGKELVTRLLMDSHQDNSAVLASMVEDLQNLAVASAWPAARLMLFNLVSQLYQGLRAKTFSGKQSQRALEMIGGVATALSLAFKTADVIVDWNSPDGYNMSNATRWQLQLDVCRALKTREAADATSRGLLEYYVASWLHDNSRELQERRSRAEAADQDSAEARSFHDDFIAQLEQHRAALLEIILPSATDKDAAETPTVTKRGKKVAVKSPVGTPAAAVDLDVDQLATRLVLDDGFKIARGARALVFKAALLDKAVLFRSTAVKVMTDLVAKVQDQHVLSNTTSFVQQLCKDQGASVRESAAGLLQHVLAATKSCSCSQVEIVTSLLHDASVAVRKKALRLVPVLASLGPLNRPLMEAVFQRFADTEDSTKKTAVEICREMWFSTDATADNVDDLQPLVELASDPLFHHVVKSIYNANSKDDKGFRNTVQRLLQYLQTPTCFNDANLRGQVLICMSKLALVCPTALADKVQQLVVHLNARYLPTADLDDRERLARLHALQATLRTLYTMLPVIPRQDDFVLAEIELQLQRMWPAMPPVVLDDLARCIAATTKFTQHEMRDDLISKAHKILTDFVDGAEREGLGVPRALLGCGLLCRYVDYDADATGFSPLEDEDGELNAESIPDVVFFSLKQYASTPIRGVDHRVPALQALGHFFARYKDKIMRTSIRELLRDALLTGSTELQLAAVSVIEGFLRAEEEELEEAAAQRQKAPNPDQQLAAFGGQDLGVGQALIHENMEGIRKCALSADAGLRREVMKLLVRVDRRGLYVPMKLVDLAVAHCTDYHPHSDRAKVSNYAEALLTSLREKQESSVLQKFRESVARAFVLRAVLGQGEGVVTHPFGQLVAVLDPLFRKLKSKDRQPLLRHLAGFMKDDVRDPLEGAGVPDGYLRRGQFVADNLALLPYELQREVLLALKECELQLTPVAQRSLKEMLSTLNSTQTLDELDEEGDPDVMHRHVAELVHCHGIDAKFIDMYKRCHALGLVFLACAFLRVKFNVSASEVTDLSTSAVTVGVDKEKKVRPLEGLGWMPGEWGWQPISDTVEPDAVASSFVLLATLCEGASEPPLLLQAAKQAKTAPGIPTSATRRPAAAFQRRPSAATTPGSSAKKAKTTRRRRRSKAISDSEDDDDEEEEEEEDVEEFED